MEGLAMASTHSSGSLEAPRIRIVPDFARIARAMRSFFPGAATLPLGRNKKPVAKWKDFQQGMSDDQLAELIREFPHANCAMLTGPTTAFVVDADGAEGVDYMLRVCDGELPHTPTVASRGRDNLEYLHFYFQHPDFEVKNAARLLPSIDWRAFGGYVVAPGSVRKDGVVSEWLTSPRDTPLARMPKPLEDFLRHGYQHDMHPPAEAKPFVGGDLSKYAERALEAESERVRSAPYGTQSMTLISAAFSIGQLVAGGAIPGSVASAELYSAGAAMANQPGREPWKEKELRDHVERGIRNGGAHPREVPKRAHADQVRYGGNGRRDEAAEREIDRLAAADGWEEPDEPDDPGEPASKRSKLGGELIMMADVQPEAVEWLWDQRIALGKLSLLVGDPDLGKSFATHYLTATVSRGDAFPDGAPALQGSVILLGSEDGLSDTVRPRLGAMNADLHRVAAFKMKKGDQERLFNLNTDLAALGEKMDELGDVRLIVIDPLTAYLGEVDPNKDAEVRALLTPLAVFAEARKVAVLGVMHLNKSAVLDIVYRVTGSIAFVGLARAVWIVAKDPNDPERRLFLRLKNNLARGTIGGLAFKIADNERGEPVVQWEDGEVTLSAHDALGGFSNQKRPRGPKPDRTDEAKNLILEVLGDGKEHLSSDLDARAEVVKLSHSTVMNARRALGVRARSKGFGPDKTWFVWLAGKQ